MHVSATAFGGGVAEILYTLVPLMKDVGLDVEWQVIYGREEFFNATKLMHNALQGAPEDLTRRAVGHLAALQRDERARAASAAGTSASSTTRSPPRCTRSCPRRRSGWVWRCHIDLLDAEPGDDRAAAALHPRLPAVASSTWSDYVPGGHERQRQHRPAGDRPARAEEHGAVARGRRLRLRAVRHRRRPAADLPGLALRPLEGPARRDRRLPDRQGGDPEVQLALVGSMASDDPEGWDFFNATIAHADGDPDIHILNNFNNVGSIEVNAFQSQADVLIQKSTREGFGLTVTRGDLEGRGRSSAATSAASRCRSRTAISGYLVDSVEALRGALARHPAGTRRWARRWGAAARSTCASTSSRRATCATTCRSSRAAGGRQGRQERCPTRARPLVLVSNRGPVTFEDDGSVKRGTGGLVTALTGPGVAPRRRLDRLGADRRRRAQGRTRPTGRPFTRRTRRRAASTRCGSSPRDPDAYDRFYNIFANPMLWFIQHYLWDLSNAPDIRRNEVEAFEFGYNVVNEDLARAVIEEIEGDDEPVVMVHDYHLYTLPALVRRARPDVFLHHFVHIPWTQPDAWRVLPQQHPRGDLRGPAGQRHHRLPHPVLPAQLPAVLPRPDGPRGRLRRRRRALRGPRGVGARLPAADRRQGAVQTSPRPSGVARPRGASCCAAAATT